MKKMVWIAILGIISLEQASGQIRWDGEGIDNLWTTAANWSGDTVPTATDDVLLDNSIVALTYLVSFAPGNSSVTVNSIRISPGASFNITLVVPTTNTSSTAFMATGAGDAVILDKGAVLINSSKAISGTPVSVSTTNFFRINNGGRYIHNTDNGHTNNLVARLSTVPGTEDGIFVFDVPGNGAYTISASNRTYGHLVFSAAAAGVNKIYTAAGISPFTINGDLEILAGATLSYGATTNNLIVSKNCSVALGATLNISNSINNSTVLLKGNLDNKGTIMETGTSMGSKIELGGTTIQQLSSAGTISQMITVTMNNAAGLILLTPLTLPYNLQLLAGNIKSTTTNLLTMLDNSSCTGGSTGSLIEGPMRKIGDDNFDFPVGIGMIYAPIGMEAGAGGINNDAFIAEYVRSNPQSVHGSITDPFFNHISFVEYWRLNRESGTATKRIKLAAQQYSFARVFNTTYATRFDGSQWNNAGRNDAVAGPVFPPNETGTLKTNELNAFGDFTLATTDDLGVNPLPLRLISFQAEKISNQLNRVEFHLQDFPIAGSVVDIERGDGEGLFRAIASVPIDPTILSYSYDDHSGEVASPSYRLRIRYEDASFSYSGVVKIKDRPATGFSIQLIANPMTGSSGSVRINNTIAGDYHWTILDMNGRVLQSRTEYLSSGEQRLSFNIVGILPGYYLFNIYNSATREFRTSVKFRKS